MCIIYHIQKKGADFMFFCIKNTNENKIKMEEKYDMMTRTHLHKKKNERWQKGTRNRTKKK